MEIFAKRLKELRQESNLSMMKLSKAIKVTDGIICRWEHNTAEPTAPNILALANFFDVSVGYLLGAENFDGSKAYDQRSYSNKGEITYKNK
jgi:transcriptional regulator with XRE-family HTH domain